MEARAGIARAALPHRLRSDDVHREVAAERGGDAAQIVRIAGHDQILTRKRRHDNGRVDEVAACASGKRLPGRTRLGLGERVDIAPMYESRQPCLRTASPSLAQHNRRERRTHATIEHTPV